MNENEQMNAARQKLADVLVKAREDVASAARDLMETAHESLKRPFWNDDGLMVEVDRELWAAMKEALKQWTAASEAFLNGL